MKLSKRNLTPQKSNSFLALVLVSVALSIIVLLLLSETAWAAGSLDKTESNSSHNDESKTTNMRDKTSLVLSLHRISKSKGSSIGSERERIAAPLALSTNVNIEVVGPIVRTTVTQTFKNPSAHWAEGIYTYPLPENAAIDQLTMHIGERIVEGKIHEKKQAKRIYQKAKSEGKRTVLLEKPRDNVFTTRVANIAPKANIRVEFSYQEVLDFRDHGYELRFPVVATPQYHGKTQQQDVLVHQAFDSPTQSRGNAVRFDVTLSPGMPVRTISSSSHQIKQQMLQEDTFRITAGSEMESNRDFILAWSYDTKPVSQIRLFTEHKGGAHYNMLMLLPPAPSAKINHRARELILVLDVSGSMSGESIRQTKSALDQSLTMLSPDDRFNLILFNSSAWSVFPNARLASPENIASARASLAHQKAENGTEMSSALSMALNTSSDVHEDGELLRQVVFITDGAVSSTDRLLAQIKASLNNSRLFTVGIGSAPNSYFMRRAAETGKGTFTYINQLSDVQAKMSALFAKLNHPALTDIEMSLDTNILDLSPRAMPDLYMNEATYLLFRSATQPSMLNINAVHGDTPATLQQPIKNSEQTSGISVEWARRKIMDLSQQASEMDSEGKALLRAQATQLALDHHQVSAYTSLVAVDTTPVRSGAELNSGNIPARLPKGWQRQGGSINSYQLAQTATNAPWLTRAGLIWLAIALCIWSLSLRFNKRTEASTNV